MSPPCAFDLQRRRPRNIRAQVVLSFEEAARGAKRTIRVAQGVPSPQNIEVDIPAGEAAHPHIHGQSCIRVFPASAWRSDVLPSPLDVEVHLPGTQDRRRLYR